MCRVNEKPNKQRMNSASSVAKESKNAGAVGDEKKKTIGDEKKKTIGDEKKKTYRNRNNNRNNNQRMHEEKTSVGKAGETTSKQTTTGQKKEPEQRMGDKAGQKEDEKGRERLESVTSSTCVICCMESNLFAIGNCQHPVCIGCGIRIRVLGNSNTCSCCRAEMGELYIVSYTVPWKQWQPPVKETKSNRLAYKYNIKFESADAAEEFNQYLAHICLHCPENMMVTFNSFDELRRHVSKEHELHFCDLCVEHLQLFSWERKTYTRQQLATHRVNGDPDDRSHRGHPKCLFCDVRYLDDDHLYRHLRKDHFFCQLCDADCAENLFYPVYAKLRQHYKERHFLCEEGPCLDLPGIVYRSEIEFSAHKAKEHGGRHTVQIFSDNGLERQHYQSYSDSDHIVRRQSKFSRGPLPQLARDAPSTLQNVVIGGNTNRAEASKVRLYRVEVANADAAQFDHNGQKQSFHLEKNDFPRLHNRAAHPPSLQNGQWKNIRHNINIDEGFPSLSSSLSSDKNNTKNKAVSSESVEEKTKAPEKANRIGGMIDDEEDFTSFSQNERNKVATTNVSENKTEPSNSQPRPRSVVQPSPTPQWCPAANAKPYGPASSFVHATGSMEQYPSLPSSSSAKSKGNKSAWAPGSVRPIHAHSSSSSSRNAGSKDLNGTRNLPQPDLWPQLDGDSSKDTGLIPLKSSMTAVPRRPHTSQSPRPIDGVESGDAPTKSLSDGPPPGFAQQAKKNDRSLPPGFEVFGLFQVIDRLQKEDFKETIVHDKAIFLRPNDFQQRNSQLMSNLQSNLDAVTFQAFIESSRMFKSGQMNAIEYWQKMTGYLKDSINEVMAEMICLLPDIDKQQALLNVYRHHWEQRSGARAKAQMGDVVQIGTERFRICAQCRQVLRQGEGDSHSKLHKENEHFPALS